jgi:hypothetical protein
MTRCKKKIGTVVVRKVMIENEEEMIISKSYWISK